MLWITVLALNYQFYSCFGDVARKVIGRARLDDSGIVLLFLLLLRNPYIPDYIPAASVQRFALPGNCRICPTLLSSPSP
jgi:hypothetical protein